jgi:sugar phosphate isomerase/epimerase
MIHSRREFLTSIVAAGGLGAIATAAAPREQAEISTALSGPVGLQLWSLREYLPKDLAGTLAKVRGMGFRNVEGAGLWKHTVEELRGALDRAGLRCPSTHAVFEQLRDDFARTLETARALGAASLVCPWIPHKSSFSREDALRSAEAFNRFGHDAEAAGLRFAYHCHGYEFVTSPEGTLFDTLAGATDPKRVGFQIDVFHAFLGGGDPAALIERYHDRVTSLHLKDLKKGWPVKAGTSEAPAQADVPVGSGQLDMPAILRAAMRARVAAYYIEDESSDPLAHIPTSVGYLEHLRL